MNSTIYIDEPHARGMLVDGFRDGLWLEMGLTTARATLWRRGRLVAVLVDAAEDDAQAGLRRRAPDAVLSVGP